MLPSASRVYLALSLPFYGVLAFGASIYGSYGYEPSGVQYAFLPFLAAPACLAFAAVLVHAGRRANVARVLLGIPFAAVVVLALPVFGMLLSNRNLEAARWATMILGVSHASQLLGHLWRVRSGGQDSRPAA